MHLTSDNKQIETLLSVMDNFGTDQEREQFLESLMPHTREQLRAKMAKREQLQAALEAGHAQVIEIDMPVYIDPDDIADLVYSKYRVSIEDEVYDRIGEVELALRCQLNTGTGEIKVLGVAD